MKKWIVFLKTLLLACFVGVNVQASINDGLVAYFHHVIKIFGILVASFFILIASNTAQAEITSYKIGQSTGAYLGATDLMIKVSASKCGKFIKNKYNFDSSENEVLSYLDGQEKKDITSFLEGEGMRTQRRENFILVDSSLKTIESEGLSNDFVCGVLIGVSSAIYNKALTDWNIAKKEIEQKKQANKEAPKSCYQTGEIVLMMMFFEKNNSLEKDMYRLEITDGKWSRSYRKAKKLLTKRNEQFDERAKLVKQIKELCEINDTQSSEYYDLKLKVEAFEEVLGLK